MPGFFVLGVFGVWAVGGEGDVGLGVGGGEGEDVEDPSASSGQALGAKKFDLVGELLPEGWEGVTMPAPQPLSFVK